MLPEHHKSLPGIKIHGRYCNFQVSPEFQRGIKVFRLRKECQCRDARRNPKNEGEINDEFEHSEIDSFILLLHLKRIYFNFRHGQSGF